MGYPPWLMWGTTHNIRATTTLGSGLQVYSQQMARVDYARPDSWQFLFWAQVNDFQGLFGSYCNLYFDLILGLGRSAVTMQAFETFKFEHGGTPPAKGLTVFSTQAQGPLRYTGDVVPNLLDDFPAQSINCVARAEVGIGSGASVIANLTVSVGFAPKTHVRPEWFLSTAPVLNTTKFRGGETGGT